jgi:hypothetical protein
VVEEVPAMKTKMGMQMRTGMRMRTRMRSVCVLGAMLLAAAFGAACAQGDDVVAPEAEDEAAATVGTETGTEAGAGPETSAAFDDDLAPIELAPTEAPAGASARKNCVNVRYCNAPGTKGTVCNWWCGSDIDAAAAECRSDAHAVCGGVTPPMYVDWTG